MDFKPMLAAPVVVMLVIASAAALGTFADSEPAAAAASHDTAGTAPVLMVTEAEPAPAAEPAAPEQSEAAEPAPVEPAVSEPEQILQDVIIRDVGQVEMTTHKSWSWNVESTEFRGYDIYLLLQTAEETVDWVAYCVESIIFDGAGQEVGRSSGALFGNEVVIDWNYADAPADATWIGEWRMELHVQGAALTQFDANVGVHY